MTGSIQARWPGRPEQPLRIYRCAAPEVTERTAAALAGRLGVPIGRFGETRSTADRVSYAEGGQRVTVYRASGGVRYRDLARWQVDHGGDLDIDDGRAEGLAREFIVRRDLAPLPECRLEKVTRLRVGLADRAGKATEERVIDVGVIFRRVLDGVVADGPGGHLMVYLGAKGEVTGFDRIWRPIDGVERVVEELQPVSWLADRLERRRDPAPEVRFEVEQVRLGYFEHGWRISQQHIQPAYVVLGVQRAGDERLRRRTVYAAPAAVDHAGEIIPLAKEIRPQPVRADG